MKSQSSVDKIYAEVRRMATTFEFKPDERINEGALAARLGASRTPLREALNRLVAEGFLTFRNGRGFFCRSLDPGRIMDLYEARLAVETEAVRCAVQRADDAAVAALKTELTATADRYARETSPEALLRLDEAFHLGVVALGGNQELERMLENLNARIRFVRWIYMRDRLDLTAAEHLRVIEAIERRDEEPAVRLMRAHVAKRSEEATEAARAAYQRIYVPDSEAG